LAQYRELAAFVQFGAELDKATKEKIERGKRITEILKQKQYNPITWEKQTMVIYAGVNGYLDDIEVNEIHNFETKFLKFIDNLHQDFIKKLNEDKDLTDKTEKSLQKIIQDFKKTFKNK